MNLIEQLEELPQLLAGEGPFYDVCVKLSDVRAIIEQHKSDMGVNLQLQIAPTVLLSKDFFGLSKDEGVLIQSWLNSAYEQIAEQHKSEAPLQETIHAQQAELEAKLAEVGKDAERLDYLSNVDLTYRVLIQSQPSGNYVFDSCIVSGLRDAIDAAIQESKKGIVCTNQNINATDVE